jgi:hypothetical protein
MKLERGWGSLCQLYRLIGFPPLARQLADAWEFQRYCAGRLVRPLAITLGATLLAAVLLPLPGIGIGALVVWWLGPIVWADPGQWPLPLWIAAIMAMLPLSTALTTAAVAAFRIVHHTMRVGRYRPGRLSLDTDRALEAADFWPALGWVTLQGCHIAVIVFASATIGHWAAAVPTATRGTGGLAMGLFLFLSVWLFVVLPQLYVFPILTVRDCGWRRAFNASLDLVRLEGWNAVIKAFTVTVLALSVVGLPAAMALVLAWIDKGELLLSAALGEKSHGQLEAAADEQAGWDPGVLAPQFELLEKGRYLDALNGFQMHLLRHANDPKAWRGQSLAYLYMGHPRARESLERWASLEPESDEAAELLAQLNAGLWREGGALFQAAQQRCTQTVGRGV